MFFRFRIRLVLEGNDLEAKASIFLQKVDKGAGVCW